VEEGAVEERAGEERESEDGHCRSDGDVLGWND
jgi:hypothetical protein